MRHVFRVEWEGEEAGLIVATDLNEAKDIAFSSDLPHPDHEETTFTKLEGWEAVSITYPEGDPPTAEEIPEGASIHAARREITASAEAWAAYLKDGGVLSEKGT